MSIFPMTQIEKYFIMLNLLNNISKLNIATPKWYTLKKI